MNAPKLPLSNSQKIEEFINQTPDRGGRVAVLLRQKTTISF